MQVQSGCLVAAKIMVSFHDLEVLILANTVFYLTEVHTYALIQRDSLQAEMYGYLQRMFTLHFLI